MNPFNETLRAWIASHGHAMSDAANLLGISRTTLHAWLSGAEPHALTIAAALARIRGELPPVHITARDFAIRLKLWRARTGNSQPVAAEALGTKREALSSWECGHAPLELIVAEILRRLETLPPSMPEKIRAICPRKIAAALRAWRRRHRLTQLDAARILGTTSIGKWEKCAQYPPRPHELLARLAAKHYTALPYKPTRPAQARALGRKLRAWRKAQRINQAALCTLLGLAVDQGRISLIERGHSLPRTALRTRIEALIQTRP